MRKIPPSSIENSQRIDRLIQQKDFVLR